MTTLFTASVHSFVRL